MADSALDVVNAALLRIGENPISAADFATPPTANKPAVMAELLYASTRDEEQRLNPWVFTLVRETLAAYATPAATLTPAATTGTGVNFTAGSAVFTANDVGKTLENQAGAGVALITAFTSSTIVVATITTAFPSTSAIASGSWRLYLSAPAHTWTRRILQPPGALRIVRVRHQVSYRAEGTYAYTFPAATLTPGTGATVRGTTGVTFTAGASTFAVTDVGRTMEYEAGAGRALITGYTSATVVTATITEAFGSTSAIASGGWRFYAVDGAALVTDAETLDVVSIARSKDPTRFDALFDEALELRLALKFAYGIAGKLDLRADLSKEYGAVIERAYQANAIETGEGKWEENAADDTQATIIQDAIARLVATPVRGPIDPVDLTATANRLYPKARPELQRMHPWRFTRRRTMLDATTTVTLTPAATTGDAITFTAGGAAFTAADVGARLLADDGGAARIVGFTSTTVVTADVETDFASTSAIAAGEWHLAPSWRWAYRYTLPTGFLRLLETQAAGWWQGDPVSWTDAGGWRLSTGEAPEQEPAVREGSYLVSDAGPTLKIEYIVEVTDAADFEPAFASCLAALLAWRLALPLTKEPRLAQLMAEAFAAELKAARTADKLDQRLPPIISNSLATVRW